jgi:hypothetical protein
VIAESTRVEAFVQQSTSEQLAYSTVRLEIRYPDGKTGTGTGFFYSFLQDGESHIPAIVTNKHVVKGAVTGKFHMTLADDDNNPKMGSHMTRGGPHPLDSSGADLRWKPPAVMPPV